MRLDLTITDGMSCASCVARFERAASEVTGVRQVSVDLVRRRAQLEVANADQPTRDALQRQVHQAGFAIRFDVAETASTAGDSWRWILAAIMAGLAWMLPHDASGHGIGVALGAVCLLIPGWPVVRRGVRIAAPSMDTLITLSALAALLIGEIHGVTMTITFAVLGRWIDERMRQRALREVQTAAERLPRTAVLVDGAVEREVPLNQVRAGDVLRLRVGAHVPVDGDLIDGEVAIDRSMLTGESMPFNGTVGAQLDGGCTVVQGTGKMRATGSGEQAAAVRLAELLRQATAAKPPVQHLVDRIAAVFVPVVMAVAGLTVVGWWLVTDDLQRGAWAAAALLAIACPCALGLATPTAIAVAVGVLARRGIYLATPRALEAAARIRCVALDKTGTLTTGRFRVASITAAEGISEADVLTLAATAEIGSTHPLGMAIRFAAMERQLASATGVHSQPTRFTHRIGGVAAEVDGRQIVVGSAEHLRSQGVETPPEHVDAAAVQVARDGRWIGAIACVDSLRDEAVPAVQDLQRLGRVVLITGDREGPARQVADRLGIDEVVAQADPARKWQVLEQLRSSGAGTKVAMVGDGLNDAPVLAASDLGIAMSHGPAAARAAADALIADDDLSAVPHLLRTARRTRRIIIQNLLLASGYNLIAIPLAAIGWVHPGIAAAMMAMSSVLVVGNSLRVKW